MVKIRDVEEAFGEFKDLAEYQNLRGDLQQWLSTKENLPQVLKAFRLSGALDYIKEGDRHAAVTRLFSNLMLTNEDRDLWRHRDLGTEYELISRALAAMDPNQLRNTGIREFAPVQALTWCAFAEGKFLQNERSGWPGVVDLACAKKANVNRWIVDRGEPDSDPQTPYSQYIDHLYDQLERRFEAIDIVFTDLVTLSDLWDRRLIQELSEDTLHAPELRKMDLSRLARLGRLVTVNYHIAGASRELAGHSNVAPPHTDPLEWAQIVRIREAVQTLVERGDAEQILRRDVNGNAADPEKALSSNAFAPPFSWLEHLQSSGTAKSPGGRLTGAVFANYWRLGKTPSSTPPRLPAGPLPSGPTVEDPRLAQMGEHAPVAPMQLAAGPHATYSAFAYFANCSKHVHGIVERTRLTRAKHKSRFFTPAGADAPIAFEEIEALLRDADRGDRLLLMPSVDELKERAFLFFNFLWQYVPATSLCYDHVASAYARDGKYEETWFDVCLPVEAGLFHKDTWWHDAVFSQAPAHLDDGPLSCLGGFSFAISERAFAPVRAQSAAEALRKEFWKKLEVAPEHIYARLRPNFEAPAWDSIRNSAVRPNLSYWATIDEMLSDTVRLYASALFVARALHAHCKALLHTTAAHYDKTTAVPRQKFIDLLGGLEEFDKDFRDFVGPRAEITLDQLFEYVRGRSDNRVVENLIYVLGELANKQFSSAPEGYRDGIRSSLGALRADSDYISGILQSCGSLGDYADHFVETIVSKINSMASSKHWAVYHVTE